MAKRKRITLTQYFEATFDDSCTIITGGTPPTKRMIRLQDEYRRRYGGRYRDGAESQRLLRGWDERYRSDERVLSLMVERMGRPAPLPKGRAKPAYNPQQERFADLYRKQMKRVAQQLPAPAQPVTSAPKLKPEAAKRLALGLASKKPRFAF